MPAASKKGGGGEGDRTDGLKAEEWNRLRRRSIRLHSVPAEQVDQFIAAAVEVTSEVEAGAEFQSRVDASFRALTSALEDECGPLILSPEDEELIHSTLETIHTHFEDPAPQVKRLTRRLIEIRSREWDEEDHDDEG